MSDYVEPEWALVTVLITDIRGFTGFADRSTAREAMDYLNAFFDLAVPVIERHGGDVQELTGDGLLATFGDDGHADAALAAGVELLAIVEESLGEACRIGVALNSGLVLVGTVRAGGLNHRTVIGDPVNVASRVESATRDLDEPLLLTEATHLLVEGDRFTLEPKGELELRGKSRRIGIFAPVTSAVTLPGRSRHRKETGWPA